MEIAAIDEGDVDRSPPQFPSGIEPPEPSSENDDTVSDTFRIAKSRL